MAGGLSGSLIDRLSSHSFASSLHRGEPTRARLPDCRSPQAGRGSVRGQCTGKLSRQQQQQQLVFEAAFLSTTGCACDHGSVHRPKPFGQVKNQTIRLSGPYLVCKLDIQLLQAKRQRNSHKVQASSLEVIDYTFYQHLPNQDINEHYLWRQRLEPSLQYLSEQHREKVREALSLAYDAHTTQMRKSGEPYITHPVEVTRILAELKMDHESLIAGLLHDTVEDTDDVSFEEIGQWFGPAVRRIVEGETRFSKIGKISGMTSVADVKAEDLRQLFLAMTEEVRIIVVKLADRLHNMRTLGSMKPEKQKKIAAETLQIFAPLARLLGLYSIKEELEELAFKYSNPEAYSQMVKRMEALSKAQGDTIQAACQSLEQLLAEDQYLSTRVDNVTIDSRQKAAYSVYRKLTDKLGVVSKKDIEEVYDVAQLHVVIQVPKGQDAMLYGTGSQLCYHIMGLVHTKWAPIPGSIKDYIATPKTNGYQSLHTTVLPLGTTSQRNPLFPLELHIRTGEMHRLAEYGIAGENWVAANKVGCDARLDPRLDSPVMQAPSYTGSSCGDTSELGIPLNNNGNGVSVNGNGVPANGNGVSANGNGVTANAGGAGTSSTDTNRGLMGLPEHMLRLTKLHMTGLTLGPIRWDGKANGKPMAAVERPLPVQPNTRYGGRKLDSQVMARRVNWLNSIRDWQQDFLGSLDAHEFVECVTDELFGKGVLVFTPFGEVMRLPKGATVLDFAYHVHTDVGNHMIGAKVNGKYVTASHQLANSEIVDILTYDGPLTRNLVARHQAWSDENMARTRSARHKLLKFLRDNAVMQTPSAQEPEPAQLDMCGTLEIVENALRQPAGQQGSVKAEPYTIRTKSHWLMIHCLDRAGTLADIARVIAQHDQNIKAYSGGPDQASELFLMKYELHGPQSKLSALCASIGAMPFVSKWSTGCLWPPSNNSGAQQ